MTGTTTNTKFRSTDNIEFLHTTTQKLEFSYSDPDGYHFMDSETFDDILLGENLVGDDKQYLVGGNSYDILFVDGQAFRLELPASVEATVIEAPEAIRGDTASNVLKPVTIDTGMTVQVPLFIKKDEKIKVSTSDGSYLGRSQG